MSIKTTSLTEMMIDAGISEPVSQKPYPIAKKHYQWFKDDREKTSHSKSNMRKSIKLVSTHHSDAQRK